MKTLNQLRNFNQISQYDIEYSNSTSSAKINSPIQITGTNINFPNYQPVQPLNPSYTYTVASQNDSDYIVFPLPISKELEAVYMNGRMLSLGVLGSEAECCFAGKDIVLSKKASSIVYNNNITLILQYKEFYYHYSLGNFIQFKNGTRTPEHKLLSKVKRG